MQEAKTRVVEVDVVDSSALQRAFSYLYTGIYDDETLPLIDYVVSETNGLQDSADGETCGIEPRELNEDAVEEVEAFVSLPQSDAQSTQTETEDIIQCEQPSPIVSAADEDRIDCCTLGKNEPRSVCNNTKLRANTFVYILADYYQIPELKRFAMKIFAAALEEICPKGFGDTCHLVYEVAPPAALDLRSCLSNGIASHGQQLVEDVSFMETTLLLPQLLRESSLGIVQQHRITSEERDAAVAASLKAEDEAKVANTKSQEDKRQVIAQVNNARRCRNCSLENNVFWNMSNRFSED
jgi:hypothetical protein